MQATRGELLTSTPLAESFSPDSIAIEKGENDEFPIRCSEVVGCRRHG
jgi:hypothetical protein